MADESKDLLASLTGNRLPALPEREEPREPTEPSGTEQEARGRSPEEVVQPRETVETESQEETALPASPKKQPKKTDVKKYPIRDPITKQVVEYTAAELEAKGLLENLATTHSQHGHLQEKYNQLLEKVASVPAQAEPQQREPEPPQEISNLMIAQTYDPVAQAITNDLLNNKLAEDDFAELYPRVFKTVAGQLRYIADEHFQLKAMVHKAVERLEGTITYLNANKSKSEGQIVESAYNKHLDGLVAKDGKLYAGLRDTKVRDGFTKFLVDEVHASSDQCTGEKAPEFLSKQWIAYNAPTILDAAKNGTADRAKRADKRFVTGEGSGTRPGVQDAEMPMLDRMIDRSGKIQQ